MSFVLLNYNRDKSSGMLIYFSLKLVNQHSIYKSTHPKEMVPKGCSMGTEIVLVYFLWIGIKYLPRFQVFFRLITAYLDV